jgi:DNA polymerase-3 subunit delta'
MNEASGNMLLKTLEEPVGNAMLVLTTSAPDQVLQTIRSRCQVLRFDRLGEQDIVRGLIEREQVEPALAGAVARISGGSYTRALDMLSDDVRQMRSDVVEFIRHALMAGPVKLVEDAERLAELKDRERVRNFILFTLMWVRDAFSLKNGGGLINDDQRTDLERFVKNFPDADLPRLMSGLELAAGWLDRNVQTKLLLMNIGLLIKATIQGETSVGSPGPLYGNPS